jgi:hypothetical protein
MSNFTPNCTFTGYDGIAITGELVTSHEDFAAAASLHSVLVRYRTHDILHMLRTQPGIAIEPFDFDHLPEYITIGIAKAGLTID